jgi:hypothetical protein
MRLDLTWASIRRPGLFPAMTGSLWVYAIVRQNAEPTAR